MRILKVLLVTVLITFSMSAFAQNSFVQPGISSMEEGLAINDAFIGFIQSRPCEFGIEKNCERPLTVKDIEKFKMLFKRLDVWNKELIKKIIPFTDRLKNLPFELTFGASFSAKVKSRFNPNKFKYEKYLTIVLNDQDVESQRFLTDVQITTASMLLMYDSLFKLSHTLARSKKARSILEYDLGEDIHVLRNTFSAALDEDFWNRTKNNINFLEKSFKTNLNINYFEQYISKSFTASKIKDNDFTFRMSSVLFIGKILSETQFLNALDKIVQKISEIFGNSVGQVQTRNGKLKKFASDPDFMDSLKSKLKPLDILLEKTSFRLTDQFIPGFFGHVAIWLGSYEELLGYKVQYEGKEIYLVDHPLLKPYLESLHDRKSVVEALRLPGVTNNTLEHFMDIDDFLVLRTVELTNPGEKILRTIMQLGKPYDFNFDIETQNAIVCSELVYSVFNDEKWPVDKTMGRYTISPDHIAWKSMDSCLDPIILFHDGNEITQDLNLKLRSFLEQPGGITHSPEKCRFDKKIRL